MSKISQITCVSSGLVALDLICLSPRFSPEASVHRQTGGSCGNVAAIVAAAGHRSIPIARLGTDPASDHIRSEFTELNVDTRFLSKDPKDRAPIIFQYLKNDGGGGHRFDLRHPVTRKHLPQFRPVTKEALREIGTRLPKADVFYADRVTPGSVQIAEFLKERGSLIFFEPQRITEKELSRILPIVDVLKSAQGRLGALECAHFPKRTITVIETLGDAGVRFQCAHSKMSAKWTSVPPVASVAAVDTAGAGDWMSAYLISEALSALKNNDAGAIAKHLKTASAWSLLAILFPGERGALRHLSIDVVKTIAHALVRADSASEHLKSIGVEGDTPAAKMSVALAALRI